jgi:SpoIID/LytB domain protein
MRAAMVRKVAATVAAGIAFAGLGAAPAGAATEFTLTGHGWGHGIGLGQYGVLGYAQHGWKYPQILEHYFTGTHIAPATNTAITERVLLAQGLSHVDVTFSTPAKVSASGTAAVSLKAGHYRIQFGTTAGRIQVVNRNTGGLAMKGLVAPVVVTPVATSLQLNEPVGNWFADHHWRGPFHIHTSGHSLMLVNWVPIEKYVAAVVPNEVDPAWPTPAVRTQAVAVRSYAYATRNPGGVYDSGLTTQTYGPIEREAAAATAAAADTDHNVVWAGSTVATTFYSSSSGGRTSSEQASFGSSSGPSYLVPVDDPYDKAGGANPNHTWAPKGYSGLGLAHLFGYSDAVRSVDQTWDAASLRERTLTLHTSTTHTLSGIGVQSQLGLRSNYFRIVQMSITTNQKPVKRGGVVTVTGRVWPRPTGTVKLLRRVAGTSAWTVGAPSLTLGTGGRFTFHTTAVSSRSFKLGTSTGGISPVVTLTVS